MYTSPRKVSLCQHQPQNHHAIVSSGIIRTCHVCNWTKELGESKERIRILVNVTQLKGQVKITIPYSSSIAIYVLFVISLSIGTVYGDLSQGTLSRSSARFRNIWSLLYRLDLYFCGLVYTQLDLV